MSCPLSIALTKLDILDVFSEIKVGMSYRVDKQMIPHFPGERESAVFYKCGFYFSFVCTFGVFKLLSTRRFFLISPQQNFCPWSCFKI